MPFSLMNDYLSTKIGSGCLGCPTCAFYRTHLPSRDARQDSVKAPAGSQRLNGPLVGFLSTAPQDRSVAFTSLFGWSRLGKLSPAHVGTLTSKTKTANLLHFASEYFRVEHLSNLYLYS